MELVAQARSVSVERVGAMPLAAQRQGMALEAGVERPRLPGGMGLLDLFRYSTEVPVPERHYFFDLLHTGLPSISTMERTYGIQHAPAVTRLSAPGWTDGTQLPPGSWYDTVAASLNPPHGWVLVDHEDWFETTQAQRLATASNFATLYNGLKSRRPDLKFAFYAFGLKHNNTWPALGTASADYQTWQQQSNDYAEVLAVVDALCPTLYFWYTEADDGLAFTQARSPGLFRGYLTDARRLLDQYGAPNRPVYPYIWWRKQDASKDLELWIWKDMLAQCKELADGFVLWGGYQQTWDANAWWINPFLESISRQVKQPRGGHRAKTTSAAGMKL